MLSCCWPAEKDVTGLSVSGKSSSDSWAATGGPNATILVGIEIGNPANVSLWSVPTYVVIPCEMDRTKAMPIIPILPANEVINVRPFLVKRLLADVFKAVENGMVVRLVINFPEASVSITSGRVSSTTRPSRSLTIRSEWMEASSELCVTMITRRPFEIFLMRSRICPLVVVSKAPVGSSANKIFGLFTKARAMATRCI